MKNFLLGTNWKMHKTFDDANAYVEGLKKLADKFTQFSYFIIPPYTHLQQMKNALLNSKIMLGAQNMHWEDQGNYTGEISPQWLCDIGVNIAELGHSERRQYYNETDEDLNKKVLSGLKYNMIPLLCVGENLKDKQYNVTKEVICKQLKIALFGVKKSQSENLWIAYEPVWAIGEAGIPAKPEYVEYVHNIIRQQLFELFGKESENIPILYGGSVNPNNCVELSKKQNVNGLFIGRSAWDLNSFEKIMNLLEDLER